METPEILMHLYDPKDRSTRTFYVIQLDEQVYRMAENDIFDCALTYGTEFKATMNNDGRHEIVQLLKASPYVTSRFMLHRQDAETAFTPIGDIIMEHAGFWQFDFEGILTVNLPNNTNLNLETLFSRFNFNPAVMKEE